KCRASRCTFRSGSSRSSWPTPSSCWASASSRASSRRAAHSAWSRPSRSGWISQPNSPLAGLLLELLNGLPQITPVLLRRLDTDLPWLERVLEGVGVLAAFDDDGHRAADARELVGPGIRYDRDPHRRDAFSHRPAVLEDEAAA